MRNGLDLSNVTLPPEDANKPAELDNINPAGDGDALSNVNGQQNNQLPPDDTEGLTTKLGPSEGESRDLLPENQGEDETPATPPVETPEKKEAAPEGDKPEDKKEDPENPEKKEEAPAADPEKKEEAATPDADVPFHKHPDWIKMQEEKKELELKTANLEGQLEVLKKDGKITEEKAEEVKSAAQVAEEKVLEKRKGGWEPRDALELNRVYGEELEKELGNRAQAAERKKIDDDAAYAKQREEIQKKVDDTYAEAGITDEAEKDKAANLVQQWSKDGVASFSLPTLKVAIDHLKAKGEIGKAPAAPTNDPKPVTAEPEKKTQDKDAINKKISKPTNEGGATNTPVKRSIGELRKESLEDIVLRNVGALG